MNLSEQLYKIAAQNAEKPAYYFLDKSTSYGELDSAVTKFANGLHKLGISKGDHVAMLLGNSPHFIIGMYGALRAGATVIPINPIYTQDEIQYILNNGDVKVIIALDSLVPLLEKMYPSLTNVEQFIICEIQAETKKLDITKLSIYPKTKTFAQMIAIENSLFQGPELDENETALILYTSGTTGKPKGAMLSHKNLYSNARDISDYLKIKATDRVVTTLPMFHVFSLTVAMNAPLIRWRYFINCTSI